MYVHYKISKRGKNNLKTLEALKTYSLNVYVFQTSKKFLYYCGIWHQNLLVLGRFFSRVFNQVYPKKTHRVFWVCARVSEPCTRWKACGRLPIHHNWTFCAILWLRRYKWKSVKVGVFRMGWITVSANFRWKGHRPPPTVGVRKLEWLPLRVVWKHPHSAVHCLVLSIFELRVCPLAKQTIRC